MYLCIICCHQKVETNRSWIQVHEIYRKILMASSALVLLLHVGHCQALLLPEKAWCLINASIAKPYLRAVTRQVLQNRCPHGVESTSFQEGKPLRGSRQIGHWRGSSGILNVTTLYKFPQWWNRKFVNYCHPCHSGQLWTAETNRVRKSGEINRQAKRRAILSRKASICAGRGRRAILGIDIRE